jgi:hypothetical protein
MSPLRDAKLFGVLPTEAIIGEKVAILIEFPLAGGTSGFIRDE